MPNMNWSLKTKIACKCELELGLGDKIVFNSSQAPSLKKMISIYQALENGSSTSETFQIDNYELIIERGNAQVKILVKWNNAIVLQRGNCYLLPYLERFKVDLLKQLLYNTNEDVRKHYCQRLLGDYNKSDDLAIGTKVETVLSENVKTVRSGYVVGQGNTKDWGGSTFYTIFTDEHFYSKRYRKEDLIKREHRN